MERYELTRLLGQGPRGAAWAARDRWTGGEVAVKQLTRGHLSLAALERDLTSHAKLRHPHVIQLRRVFLTTEHLNIVTDLASRASLAAFLRAERRLPEWLARWVVQQLALALDYCHARLPPRAGGWVGGRGGGGAEGVLLEWPPGAPVPIVKLAVFRYSLHAPQARSASLASLTAPEVLRGEVVRGGDPQAADIWCLGVVLYTMLVGHDPFCEPSQAATSGTSLAAAAAAAAADSPGRRASLDGAEAVVLRRMEARHWLAPLGPGVSASCAYLLRRLLEPRPAARVRMAQLLQDPWFLEALPPEALTMNSRYLAAPPATEQSEAEISAVLAAAGASDAPRSPASEGPAD